MACACGGSAKNAETNRVHTVAAGGNPNSLNIGTTRTVVPMNAQRAAALGATNSNGDSQYLSPQRLRVEKLRREAIQNALNKQFL